MELKRRKVRRGARRHIEHVLDGRPLTAYRRMGTPIDGDDPDGRDMTPCKPFSRDDFMARITAAALADPWGLGLVMGLTNPLLG